MTDHGKRSLCLIIMHYQGFHCHQKLNHHQKSRFGGGGGYTHVFLFSVNVWSSPPAEALVFVYRVQRKNEFRENVHQPVNSQQVTLKEKKFYY